MRLAVDADILGILQRSRGLAAIQPLGSLSWVITDTVWEEVTIQAAANGANAATVAEMDAFLVAVASQPMVIAPQTPEAHTLQSLSRPPVKEDPGELSIIAYTIHHPDTVPVLHDRAAIFRAVEELHGRVLSIHGLLHRLVGENGLPLAAAQEISLWYCKRYGPTRPPTWWV